MLNLPIKKLWFDMILSGIKKEEYREMKPYYRTRLINEGFLDSQGNPTPLRDWIILRNGYSKKSPSFMAYCQLSIKEGIPEWGATPNTEYYTFQILEKRDV